VITDHLSLNSFKALTGYWSSEDSQRGMLSRSYQAMINGRESDLDGKGLYALIRFAGRELGIVPEPRYA
jgi:hypothetical protein